MANTDIAVDPLESLQQASITGFELRPTLVPEEHQNIEGGVSNRNEIPRDHCPPNGGYGWICTACAFLINAHTWGINAAWGVFLAHFLSHSTFPGATHFEYALIGGLSVSQAMLIGPLISWASKRFGSRISLLIGTIMEAAALFSASYATKTWHLFLTVGVCFGWGMGFLYITATAVLPAWFSTKRSLAVGIASSGAGLGGLVYNLAAGRAIQTMGIASTWKLLAFISLGANMISALLMKDCEDRRQQSRHRAFDYRQFKHVEVLLLVVWGSLTEFGYIAVLYSLPNYASAIGLSAAQGSVAGAMLNLGLCIGRPPVGYISDRFGRINASLCMTAYCGLLCLCLWIPATSYPILLAFAILVGMVCGTFWCTIGPVTAEVVGLERLSATFGLVCLSLVVPTTFAEPAALNLVSDSGYLSTQIFVACAFLAAALCLGILRSWQFYSIEKKAAVERATTSSEAAFTTYFRWLSPRKLFLRGYV